LFESVLVSLQSWTSSKSQKLTSLAVFILNLKYVEFRPKVGNGVHGVKETTKAIDYHDSSSYKIKVTITLKSYLLYFE
jgi:hypothetical protein